jgi:DNA polymerase-3 subunit gamma/tau
MSYQVLARKWRPRTFETLVGQEHVVKALTHALEQGRLHHAYLFTGTRGVGKTTLARILAKSLNCEKGISAKPCGQCSACMEIDAGRFVDLIEVDAATNTKVDEMRQLLENAVYSPTRGRFKVYVIDEVHMLSTSAFNAMLKTLEEPPEHIKFVLATTDPQKIPVTVLSRCLQFNLKQMPPAAISSHLARVLADEKIKAEPTALRLIAAAAKGSMRDALSLLDQSIAYSAGEVTEASVRAMLGTVDDGFLVELLQALADGNPGAALAVADNMEARNLSFDAALLDLGTLLHRIALSQSVPSSISSDDPQADAIAGLARAIQPEEIQLYYQIALHGRQDLPLAPDGYAGFTMTLLRMFAFGPEGADAPVPEKVGGGSASAAPRSAGGRGAASAAAPGPRSFDGNWPALAKALNVSGMGRQLAQQSELKSFDGDAMELCVPPSVKHLAEKVYQEKLRVALQEHFGRPVRLVVNVGATTGHSAQDQAMASIQQDAFVRDVVENFDATIVTSSVKPVQ